MDRSKPIVKNIPSGEPFLMTSSNIIEWMLQFKQWAVSKRGYMANILDSEEELEFIIPPEPEHGDPANGGNSILRRYYKLVEDIDRESREYPRVKAQLMADIFGHISTESERKVRQHVNFNLATGPIELFQLVQQVHTVTASSNVFQIMLERTALRALKLEKLDIEQYATVFRRQVEKLIYIGDTTITDASSAQDFLQSLNTDFYATQMVQWVNQDQIPETLAEAMTLAINYKRLYDSTRANMLNHQVKSSTPSPDTASFVAAGGGRGDGRGRGRGGRGDGRGRGRGGRGDGKHTEEVIACKYCEKPHPTEKCFKLLALMKSIGATIPSTPIVPSSKVSTTLLTTMDVGFSSVDVALKSFLAGVPGGATDNLILDTGSTNNVICNASFAKNIDQADEGGKLLGISGNEISVDQICETHHFGSAIYSPSAITNLISLGKVTADGSFRVWTKEDGSKIKLWNKDYVFYFNRIPAVNLYILERDNVSMIATDNIKESLFTSKQKERALIARKMCRILSHPGETVLAKLLDNGTITDALITGADVRRASDLWGKCPGCLQGKLTCRPQIRLPWPECEQPGHELHIDYFFMPGPQKSIIPYLISVDRCTDMTIITTRKDRKTATTIDNITAHIHQYKVWGKDVKKIVSDMEGIFLASTSALNAIGVGHTTCAPGQHVALAERKIRTIKEHFTATYSELRYNLPASLYKYLAEYVVCSFNMLPKTNSSCAREKITGIRLSIKLACRAAFGQFVKCYRSNQAKTLLPGIRTEDGIIIGRNVETGAVKVWLISSGEIVTRDIFEPQELTDTIIAAINSKAAEEQITYGTILPMTTLRDTRISSINNSDLDFENVIDGDETDENDTTSSEFEDSESDDDLEAVADIVDHEGELQLSTSVESILPVSVESILPVSVETLLPVLPVEAEKRYPSRGNRTTWNPIASLVTGSSSPEDIAIFAELQQMLDMDVWDPVLSSSISAEDHANIIPSSIILKSKEDIIKARLVAGGHREVEQPFECTNSPTVATESLMILLALSAQQQRQLATIDIKGAYLNAPFSRRQFMILPSKIATHLIRLRPEYASFANTKGNIIVKLKKALYGLTESAKLWYSHVRATLEEIGYVASHEDQCVFTKKSKTGTCSIGIHVDDFLVASSNNELLNEVFYHLEQRYPGIKTNTSDKLSYLGLEIDINKNKKTITVKQSKYIEECLLANSTIGTTSTPANRLLLKATSGESTDAHNYLSDVMKLMYLAKRTRPDILFAISYLATRSKDANLEDRKNLDHVFKYLNGTRKLGICFNAESPSLCCYCDASYAIHSDAKSHSGILYSLGRNNGPIMTKSSKQKLVAQSSTEAELIALHEGVDTVDWMINFLKSLGVSFTPATVFQDNKSTIQLAERGSPASKRSKHIMVRYFSMKEKIDKGDIKLEYLPTALMIADIFTKPLQGELFRNIRAALLNME